MAITSGWGKRHTITIDNTKVSGSANHSNFPVLLTEDNFLTDAFDNSDNGGGDIRFSSDTSGATQLSCEIITWDNGATDKAEVYVKVPTLDHDDDTVIYVWYDNTGASQPARDASYGSDDVWSNGYELVLHMGNVNDSSANQYDFTNSGVTFNTTNPKIGTSGDFESGEDDYMTIADASCADLEISGSQTWQGWVRFETGNADQRVWTKGWPLRAMYLGNAAGGYSPHWYIGDLTTNDFVVDTTFAVSVDTWYLLHGVYDSVGETLKIIRDGTNVTSVAASGVLADTNEDVYLGRRTGSTADDFDGRLDEFRVSSAVRNNDWCATEYNNQHAPSTFATESDATAVSWFIPKVIFIT